jgi:hypothetical protein
MSERKLYNFREQMGQSCEEYLDEVFGDRVEIGPGNQARGYDRMWNIPLEGWKKVEYKADRGITKHGNVAVELCVCQFDGSRPAKYGWAIHSEADYVLLFSPQTGDCWFVEMGYIREMLPKWFEMYRYKFRAVVNGDDSPEYFSIILTVPRGAIRHKWHVQVDPV